MGQVIRPVPSLLNRLFFSDIFLRILRYAMGARGSFFMFVALLLPTVKKNHEKNLVIKFHHRIFALLDIFYSLQKHGRHFWGFKI